MPGPSGRRRDEGFSLGNDLLCAAVELRRPVFVELLEMRDGE